MSIREDLKAYVDGELSPERALEVAKAIEHDPDLQQEVEFMRSLTLSLRSLKREAVTPSSRPILTQRRRPKLPVWSYAAGALLLFAAIGLLNRPTLQRSLLGADREASSPVPSRQAPKEAMDWEAGSTPPATSAPMDSATESDGYAGSDRPAIAVPGSDREVIRRADLNLEVDSVSKRLSEATNLARSLGGYTESSSIITADPKRPSATVSLRVPSRAFDQAMTSFRALGDVKSESVSGEDVTAAVADVKARLKALRSEEEQYLVILRRTTRIGEILSVKERLGQVRAQIESLDAQQRALQGLVSMSTISLSMTQSYRGEQIGAGKDWTSETFAHAKAILSSLAIAIAQGAIYIFTLTPIWLPIVLVAKWLRRRSAA